MNQLNEGRKSVFETLLSGNSRILKCIFFPEFNIIRRNYYGVLLSVGDKENYRVITIANNTGRLISCHNSGSLLKIETGEFRELLFSFNSSKTQLLSRQVLINTSGTLCPFFLLNNLKKKF